MLNHNAFQMSPTCECNEFSGCAARGTLDLYQCLKLFVSASSPHYYLAEANIRDTIDGMNPNEKLHETGCYLDLVRREIFAESA